MSATMGQSLTEAEELERLRAALRVGGPDFGAPPERLRADFEALLATFPVAEDIDCEAVTMGGVAALKLHLPATRSDAALLYFHGGAYVAGSAAGYKGLAAELGRATGVITWSVDYRLAPEHPFPAAVEDAIASYRALLDAGIAAGRIVLAGDSAGGGLVAAALVAIRDADLAMPAAALLISPWADLSCSGDSIASKAAEDLSLTVAGLRGCAAHYLQDHDSGTPLASPVRADLSGLPPLLIQVGSAEILLDDAVALVRAAGAAGVAVDLRIWPGMPHVWHAFAFMLTAGRRAIAQAGDFLSHAIAGEC